MNNGMSDGSTSGNNAGPGTSSSSGSGQ
jgi:hypothetical protein